MSAVEAYRSNPSCDNAANLRTALKEYLLAQQSRGTPIAAIGPFLGCMDSIAQLHDHDIGISGKFLMWSLRQMLKSNRPGWNDYWMMRWMCTHDPIALMKIHDRCAPHLTTPWPSVVETARWMVSSYRQQDKVFDHQMARVERDCELCRGNT